MKRGIKNQKMSTLITVSIALVTACCTLLLFLLANRNMRIAMYDTAMSNMDTTLVAKTEIIEQSVSGRSHCWFPMERHRWLQSF